MKRVRNNRREQGTALIEATLIIPLLILLLGGMVTFGFYFMNSSSVLRWTYLVSAKAAEFPTYLEDDARIEQAQTYALDIEAATIGLSTARKFLLVNNDSFLQYARTPGSPSAVDSRPPTTLAFAAIEGVSTGSNFGSSQNTNKQFSFPELKRGNPTPMDPDFQSSGALAIDCCGNPVTVFSCISGFNYLCSDISQVGYYDNP